MARSFFRTKSLWAASAASLAALSMAAAPLAAARPSLPRHAPAASASHGSVLEAQSMEWRGRHRHRHNDGIDGGDILAGVLILGGIAAIASAASKNDRDSEPYPYPDERPAYPERSGYSGGYGGGIDNAVYMCTNEVERGNDRVAAVDNASRTNDGWRISGQLDAGGNFSCWIDNDGRIRNIDLGGGYSYGDGTDDRPYYEGAAYDGSAAPGQWDDAAYASARAQIGYAAR